MAMSYSCHNFLYRAMSLVENISKTAKRKNNSLESFLKIFLINVYEYMGFDRIHVFRRKENDSFYSILSIIENQLAYLNVSVDVRRFKGIKSFKGVQMLFYEDELLSYLKLKQLIKASPQGKVFIKYLELDDEYIVIFESYSIFTEIPIYMDIMILEIMFKFLEGFVDLRQNFQTEIDKYEEEKNNLIELVNTLYGDKFIANNDLLISKVATTDVNVLLEGETGTGKSSLAYHIHNISHRKDKPFVVIDCSTIPKELFEVELFGYERGAFTGAQSRKKGKLELAQGGTVFFDEIGDIPHDFQLKLLRLIQEKTFTKVGGIEEIPLDVRFIFATNKNLEDLVRKGEFREDLYYRITVFKLRLPPFRDRSMSEKKLIIDTILSKLERKYSKRVKITPEVLKVFERYNWPGNIRELENVLEYAVIMCDTDTLCVNHLPTWLVTKVINKDMDFHNSEKTKEQGSYISTYKELQNFEIESIIHALISSKFNVTKAASILGLTRRQLEYRIEKYKIFDKIKMRNVL